MTDTLTKLYAGLSDEERGKLAYAYMVQGNDLEMKRIASTMPEQYFVGLPYGYRRMFHSLTNLMMSYAVAYWQQVSKCQAFMSATMSLIHDDDPKAYLPMKQRLQAAETVLLAIEQAFDDVCLDHGLDRDLMRGMAGHRFYEAAMPALKPDDACLAGYREIFASTMT